MLRCFSFGSSNIHGASMGAIPEKKDTSLNRWHYRRKRKMPIDFKGFFRNKNHRQRKINNLGRLGSRRWVKI